jgi:hypothetical protein
MIGNIPLRNVFSPISGLAYLLKCSKRFQEAKSAASPAGLTSETLFMGLPPHDRPGPKELVF